MPVVPELTRVPILSLQALARLFTLGPVQIVEFQTHGTLPKRTRSLIRNPCYPPLRHDTMPPVGVSLLRCGVPSR
jgi:hypothetical protein